MILEALLEVTVYAAILWLSHAITHKRPMARFINKGDTR
jgi:hypothetical protein